jgi:hypothetical protein
LLILPLYPFGEFKIQNLALERSEGSEFKMGDWGLGTGQKRQGSRELSSRGNKPFSSASSVIGKKILLIVSQLTLEISTAIRIF